MLLNTWTILLFVLLMFLIAGMVSTLSIQWWREELESQIEEVIKLKKTQFVKSGEVTDRQSCGQEREVRHLLKAELKAEIDDILQYDINPLRDKIDSARDVLTAQRKVLESLQDNPAIKEGLLRQKLAEKEAEMAHLNAALESLKGFKAEGTE